MKVRCICDFISIENSPLSIVEWCNNTELEITIGKTYTVLAVTQIFGEIFYYILGDESDNYPLAFPYYLFELECGKISKYWIGYTGELKRPEEITINDGDVISFMEWSLKKGLFYGNLIEEYPEEARIFSSYRDKILSE